MFGSNALDGFKVYDFSQKTPRASITNHGFTISKSTFERIGNPEYIQILVNEADRLIAIRSCSKEDAESKKTNANNKRVKYLRINDKSFMKWIVELTGIDLSKNAYDLRSVVYEEEKAVVFKLNGMKKKD